MSETLDVQVWSSVKALGPGIGAGSGRSWFLNWSLSKGLMVRVFIPSGEDIVPIRHDSGSIPGDRTI